jgi:ferritin-like metal-binding protein YciE
MFVQGADRLPKPNTAEELAEAIGALVVLGRAEQYGSSRVDRSAILERPAPPASHGYPLRSKTMGLFTTDIKSMEDLFLHTLQDVYYAEKQIVKSLPSMIEKATNRELAKGLRDHLKETENQVMRLDKVFENLGETPKGTDCPAIDGLIKEAGDVAGEVDDKKVLDAAVIGSAQAIEHYEISRYGTLIAWAEELGYDNVTGLLRANLREEKAADKRLSGLAESKVNRKASGHRVAAQRSAVTKRKTGSAKRPARKK